jgi:outer membrane immunogenic protein
MRFLKAIVLAAAAFLVAVLLTSPTSAQTKPTKARNLTGCYAGVHAGGSIATTELGLGGLGIDSIASRGAVGGVHAGCDWHFVGTPLVVGAAAAYDWSKVEFTVDPGLFSAKIDKTWSVGGRVGGVVAGTLIYLPVGYIRSDLEFSAGVPTQDLKGWYTGAGFELLVTDNLTVGAEYRFARYERVTLGGFLNLDTD